MDRNQPEAAAASGGMTAPKTASAQNAAGTPGAAGTVSAADVSGIAGAAAREPFSASARECVAALLMYPLAYLYLEAYTRYFGVSTPLPARVLIAVFTLGYIALTEFLHRGTPRRRESFVWLGCAALLLCSVVFGRGRAWEDPWGGGMPFLFLHILAVWWALSRSGALLAGESGRLLPLDALDGFAAFPFQHFFLRARTAAFTFSRLRGERKHGGSGGGAPARTLVTAAAAAGLFALAASLLMDADSGFAALLDGVAGWFRFDWNAALWNERLFRFLLSLPVGAYLYGLLGGTLREDKTALRERAERVDGLLAALRGVREPVWFALLLLFCLLYALFFAVQGRYLFGAFTRTLPEGFIVSEYARQGFFELCKVMTVNFALLWLVSRTAKNGVRERRALLALCLALLAESLLLAVVAFSKLALYISCFGFTPRRLQSTWLVCVLAFGTVCAAWSLAKNAKTFRVWMCFGAVTLSLLCLY